MNMLLSQLNQAVNFTTLIVGIVIGAAGMLAIQALLDFILNHWKPILIVCAAIIATSAAVIAGRGGF